MNEHTEQIESLPGSLHARNGVPVWLAAATMLTAIALLIFTSRFALELWLRSPTLFLATETGSAIEFAQASGIVVNLPASKVSVVASDADQAAVAVDWEFVYAGARPTLTHGWATADPADGQDAPLLLTVDLSCTSRSFLSSLAVRENCWADHSFAVPAHGDVQITTSMGSIEVHGIDGELTLASTSRRVPSLRELLPTGHGLFFVGVQRIPVPTRGAFPLNGDIFITDAKGPLTLYSATGDILGSGLASPRADVRADGPLRHVYLHFVLPPEQITIETAMADSVIVEVPPGDAYRIDVSRSDHVPRVNLSVRPDMAFVPESAESALLAGWNLQIDVEQNPDATRSIQLQVHDRTRVFIRYADPSN